MIQTKPPEVCTFCEDVPVVTPATLFLVGASWAGGVLGQINSVESFREPLITLVLFDFDSQFVDEVETFCQESVDASLALGDVLADHKFAVFAHIVD